MPVKSFVTRDPQGQPWPPSNEHEATAAIGIIQRLYEALNHERGQYVVLANLHRPSADLVVLSELGLGVIELKHTTGRLTVVDDGWFGGGRAIKAGTAYHNPHDQAMDYARRMRNDLLSRLAEFWETSPREITDALRIQYAVCFTNPAMLIPAETKEQLERSANASGRRPGNFAILVPREVPAWVASLRFGVEQDQSKQHVPFRLGARHIAALVGGYFKGSEWTEIRNLMPTGQPYAYLTLQQPGRPSQLFPLRVTDTTLGRDGTLCTLLIPETFKRVSRTHARLTRVAHAVVLSDLESSHGCFIDGVRVAEPTVLRPGQRITLGGATADERVCELCFSRELPAEFRATATAADTTTDRGQST